MRFAASRSRSFSFLMQTFPEVGRFRFGNNSLWKPTDLLSTVDFNLYWGFAFLQLLDVTIVRVQKFAHRALLLVKVIGDCRFNSLAYTINCHKGDEVDVGLLNELIDCRGKHTVLLNKF